MEVLNDPAVRCHRARSEEVVRVPVKTILYLQAMVENGREDRPKALGPALPAGHVLYQQ